MARCFWTAEALLPGELPRRYVERVTLAKGAAARKALAHAALAPRPILVADTTVALGSRVLGKPRDAADAAAMLRALSGRTHRVMTAVAVVRGERIAHRVNVSRVRFARISAARIDAYVASGEPMDKAGAYGIQGFAATFVRNIEGSHSGIMGLPLFETAQLLRAAR